ncbi:MAG: Stk1 family PASTA domain-containing Ser/Thr kinase [Actinobacteria bacterium]|nr:Stk1 family PASTA domain-containing Ser/Thr kinase [Actinomycetota bacterium]
MTVLQSGTLVDSRYKVAQRIGSGGMADVYLCEDQHLHRQVALKVMHERFAQDKQFVERFEREAQAAAGLQHKNVVGVYDRGQVGGTYYIAMEYLTGRTLKDVVNAMGALDPKLAIHIVQQVLAAAKFAHSRGIVHRDIKPQNVMIDDEWNVKVTDFGIAHNPVAGDVTQTGQMIGTAQYISPEQAQGKPISSASDIYSTGAVLFELLTGKVPFDGESSVAIALKHINEPAPRPSLVNPAVPPVLDAVVLKAMAKSPVERFASADEFSAALENAKVSLGEGAGKTEIRSAPTAVAATAAVAATPPSEDELKRKRRKRNWIIAGCVLAAIAVALLLWFLLAGNKQTVPNVIGRSVGDAQSRLASAGFESQVFNEQTTKAPAGEVFKQSPGGGEEAKKGSTVILTVSSGPGKVVMPDVSGLKQSEATEKLEAQGLKVTVKKEFDPDVKKGRAIRTTPLAGTTAEKGSEVDLYISKGPEQIEVPNVVGMDIEEATTTLEKDGFEVDTIEEDSSEDEGQVLKQSPAATTKADDGSTVKLTVASGTNDVPDVTGLSEADATQELEDAGFKVETSEVDVPDSDDDGNVVGQDPSSGTASVGSIVTIEVGVFSGTE